MSNSLIYALVDPRDKAIRYIGQSSVGIKRPKQHLSPCIYNKVKGHVYNWIKLLASINMKPEILILETCKQEELNDKEIHYIQKYRSQGCNLTNHDDGGKGKHGYHHSDETKRKLSEAGKKQKGRKLTKEHIEKIAAGNKGKKLSEETRERLSKAHKGKTRKPFSDEHKAKLAAVLVKARRVRSKASS